jgi:ADP-ribose pyrophosphatase YjhB (NUDIX family)
MVTAAGCLFIQHGLALAGYSNKYKYFSGLGGKITQNETPEHAAYRETLEELFEIKPPPAALIEQCITQFSKNPHYIQDKYYFKILSFDDYTLMAQLLDAHAVSSILYAGIPPNFLRLLLERNTEIQAAEIGELKVIRYGLPAQNVDINFIKDCKFAEKVVAQTNKLFLAPK